MICRIEGPIDEYTPDICLSYHQREVDPQDYKAIPPHCEGCFCLLVRVNGDTINKGPEIKAIKSII